MSYNVFTYGTLMSDGTFRAMTNATMDEMSEIEPTTAVLFFFRRHGVVRAGFPAIVQGGQGDSVVGVLWQGVTDKMLARLDQYEGVPTLYTREEVAVTLPDGTQKDAFVYVWGKEGSRGLDSQDWMQGDLLAMMHKGYDDCKMIQRDSL